MDRGKEEFFLAGQKLEIRERMAEKQVLFQHQFQHLKFEIMFVCVSRTFPPSFFKSNNANIHTKLEYFHNEQVKIYILKFDPLVVIY